MPLQYQRDIPADSPPDVVAATEAHVRDHLAAIADADDDPATRSDDVGVWLARHPDDPGQLRVEGVLDAEPDAPYLRQDFDPLAEVDPALYEAEVAAALRDEEAGREN